MQNVIEPAVITSQCGALQIDLPGPGKADQSPWRSVTGAGPANESDVTPDAEMQRRKHDNVLAALQRSDWRVRGPGGAAELLGVKPTTLISRIKKMGLKELDCPTGSAA